MELRLTTLDGRFAVCQFPAQAEVPPWAAGELVSVTRTAAELSVVCSESVVPDGTTAERGWRCLRVQGRLSFELTGVLAELARPLAEADIPVFCLSTFDTDYLLVKEKQLNHASKALERGGHVVDRPQASPSK